MSYKKNKLQPPYVNLAGFKADGESPVFAGVRLMD